MQKVAPLPKVPDSIKLKISLYPNPFTNVININSNEDTEVVGQTLNLYGTSGKLYLSQTIVSSNTTLNLSNLVPGMYILKIEGKKGPHIL